MPSDFPGGFSFASRERWEHANCRNQHWHSLTLTRLLMANDIVGWPLSLNAWQGTNLCKKLGSNLGQLSAENGLKPGSVTQNQAKRINEIAFRWLFRDQGVGGSNPLSPTNLFNNSRSSPGNEGSHKRVSIVRVGCWPDVNSRQKLAAAKLSPVDNSYDYDLFRIVTFIFRSRHCQVRIISSYVSVNSIYSQAASE